MSEETQGWRGRGKARIARWDGRFLLRYQGLGTRGGRLQEPILQLIRKDYRSLRPTYDLFAVSLWIEAIEPARYDVDNVAKALLDVLKGVVWMDDRQIRRLTVEKLEAGRDVITLLAEPYEGDAPAEGRARLEALLDEAEGSG